MADKPLLQLRETPQHMLGGMRGRRGAVRRCLIAAGLMLSAIAFAAPDGNAAGEMDPKERAVLEELNLARTRPAEYARYLDEHKRNFKGPLIAVVDGRKIKTVEGFAAVDEAIAFLKNTAPVPTLSDSRPLTLSARDHAKDLGPRGMTGHIGTDSSQPSDRIARYGAPRTISGEGITFGPISARSIVIQLIVDDDVPGRDHRKNVFEPAYRVAGVAIGPHKFYEYTCVINFADQVDEKNVAR